MPDQPENVTLEFLGQQMAKLLEEMRSMRADMSAMQRDVATLSETSGKTIDAVFTIARDVDQLKETSAIIEGRLVRIEKRMDLVKV